jgi:hypothetical protein
MALAGQSPTAANAHDLVTSERGGKRRPEPIYRAVEPWLLYYYYYFTIILDSKLCLNFLYVEVRFFSFLS